MVVSKWAKLGAVCGAAVLATAGIYAMAPGGDGVSGTGAKTLADPLSLIRQDSPGARNAVALANKNLPVAARPVAIVRPQAARPTQVAANQPERFSEVLPTAVGAPALVQAAGPVAAVPLAAAPAAAAVPAAGIVPAVAAIPIAAGAAGGSGALAFLALPAGLGALALGGDDNGGSPSFAPAVPEPETWLMMILGFGFLGATMRKRRREQRKAALGGSNLSAA